MENEFCIMTVMDMDEQRKIEIIELVNNADERKLKLIYQYIKSLMAQT